MVQLRMIIQKVIWSNVLSVGEFSRMETEKKQISEIKLKMIYSYRTYQLSNYQTKRIF